MTAVRRSLGSEKKSGKKWPRLARVSAAALLATLVGAGAALAANSSLSVQNVNVKRYPAVNMTVTVTGAAAERLLAASDFDIRENGRAVRSLKVEPIANAPEPTAVALVIDTSGSMRGAPLEGAKAAARVFIRQMKAQDRVAIISFNSTYVVAAPFSSDKAALQRAIDGLGASGETAVYDALSAAVDAVGKSGLPQKSIILLSDGGDTVSKTTGAACLNRVLASKTPVYLVALQSPEFNPNVLSDIAAKSGGRTLLAASPSALSAFYALLAVELHNQYRVSYESWKPAARKVDIVVNLRAQGLSGAGQSSFDNPKPSSATSVSPKPAGPTAVERIAAQPGFMLFVLPLAFGAAFLMAFVLISFVLPEESTLKQQMRFYERIGKRRSRGVERKARASETVEAGAQGTGIRARVVALADRMARWHGLKEFAQLKLEQAGLPLRPLEYMSLHFLFVLAAGLLITFLTDDFITGLLFVIILAFIPGVFVQILISRRKRAFHDQMPDVLQMVAGSLRAGYSFLQAINLVIQETGPPISSEFKRVVSESRLGLPLEESLLRVADRVDIEEFRWTVMAINIQREVGGNLAEVLEIIARTLRERDQVGRQIRVLTAEGRLSALILIVLPFFQAGLLFIINRQYVMLLFTDPIGWVMIAGALLLMLVGGLWLRKIVAIEV